MERTLNNSYKWNDMEINLMGSNLKDTNDWNSGNSQLHLHMNSPLQALTESQGI